MAGLGVSVVVQTQLGGGNGKAGDGALLSLVVTLSRALT